MIIGFDPHLENINAAFSRYFSRSNNEVTFEMLERPRWADGTLMLPLRMAAFVIRFFWGTVFRYDVVHVNSAKVGIVAWLASFFGGRYVYTIHGCPHPELERQEGSFKSFLSAVEIFCMKRVVKRAQCVSTISEFSRMELKERFGIDADVHYNGVDPMKPSMSKGDAKAALGISGCSPVYISVGRLVAYKNPMRVLDIFCRAEKDNADARLIYIGNGILRAPLLARAGALGMRDRLIFMPEVSFEKIPDCYAAADYFISACDTEGFGLAALESLMCGCRPLLPRKGAFPEIFRDQSFFYDDDFLFTKSPADAALADAILSSFTWERALVSWEQTYRESMK